MNSKSTYQIAIFASGTGSNARKIIDYFSHNPTVQVSMVLCNKPGAGVLAIAAEYDIPSLIINKAQFLNGNAYVDELRQAGIDLIVLAGFLWKIPAALIAAYPERIINIHPALLPKYGGKGMYGQYVHEAVIGAKEKESGITIHLVDEEYDHGKHLFQSSCPVLPDDTTESLAQKIHALEYTHFAKVIEQYIDSLR